MNVVKTHPGHQLQRINCMDDLMVINMNEPSLEGILAMCRIVVFSHEGIQTF
jgi:hypothetical protein